MKTSKIRVSMPYVSMFVCTPVEVKVVNSKKDSKKKEEFIKVNLVSFNGQADSRGMPLVLPVDQFSGKPFNLNPQGFPMNDIMAYEHAQSNSYAESVLRRINVLHPESIDQNLTPDEMFEHIVPSNWSSPAEYVRAHKMVTERWFARHKVSELESGSEPGVNSTIKFDDPNSNPVSE